MALFSTNLLLRELLVFIIFLRFANKELAADNMQAHMEWVQRGLDDQVFMLVGSLQPNQGGGILAHNTTMEALKSRVDADPFVQQGVVVPDIMELTPAKADARLAFLLQ